MDTNGDSFEKHRKLIEFLMSPEVWSRAKGDVSSILFYSSAVREEYTGPLNENQKHLLSIVNYHAKTLSEILDIFTMASHVLFSSKHIEIQEVDLLDGLAKLEKELNKDYPDIQIDKVVENDLPFIQGDIYLIQEAFKNLGRVIRQIHSSNTGNISIKVSSEEGMAKILITRNKEDFVHENGLSVFPFDVNPEWFIVHTIAEIHGGEFSIDDSHKNECIFYLNLPLQPIN